MHRQLRSLIKRLSERALFRLLRARTRCARPCTNSNAAPMRAHKRKHSQHPPPPLFAYTHRLLRESRQTLTIPEADEERWPGATAAAANGGGAAAGAGAAAAAAHDGAPSTSGREAGCPVFVMLPLDTVWVVERDGKRVRAISAAWRAAGVAAR